MSSTEPGDEARASTPMTTYGAPPETRGDDDVAGRDHDHDHDDLRGAGQDEGDDGLFPAPVTPAPRTGDPALDDALAGLEDAARSGDPEAQVVAGERVHRELHQRLTHLEGPQSG